MKLNLPVVLLKGLVILPNNDLRLEFENDESRNIIDLSTMFHDNQLLIVTQVDLEESPNTEDLPKIGIVAEITHKLELPSNRLRVILKGKKRANVLEYLNLNNNILESIIELQEDTKIEESKENIMVEKIKREFSICVKNIPYLGNSIIESINKIKKLNKLTDVIVPNLPLSKERMLIYLNTFDSYERAKMLLIDINKEKEMFELDNSLNLKVKKNIDKQQKEYFLREKLELIKDELNEQNKDNDIENKIKNLNAPLYIKEKLTEELKKYREYPKTSPEIGNIKNYIDLLLELPWENKTKDTEDLNKVLKTLNKTHSGLDKVKTRIIEYLAASKHSNNIKSPIICLLGPSGVGKTTLALSIAQALNRSFYKISVAGINDESEIIGHRRTYLGSRPGKIIQAMKKCKTNNPLLLIDEIDKMTKDIKGDPQSALLTALDKEQNNQFQDNYLEEYYDLSNVLFITTANNIENIEEALKDRLEIINIEGYTSYEKLEIVKKNMLKKLCKEYNLDIKISKNAILKIIEEYTKEAGVRELERLIETIIRKEVTNKVLNKKYKTKINENDILFYLGNPIYTNDIIEINTPGIVNGLAYTKYGGDVLPIESNYYPGNGNIILTGSLGEVMQESAKIALSYIKSNYKYFNIDYDLFKNDIHINAIECAIKKEGPSAGITLVTSILSILKNQPISNTYAMTGEITLNGKVLKIGGLKEKVLGASRNNIKTIFIPKSNEIDLDNINKEIKDEITFIKVSDYKEIYEYLFK